ncbi:MAG: Com family DNA-binding transcriptional regulator [Pseudomonadota bacterium]|nr:Com family DNA-binding transcriptional regulator [Pseudomonadota bacterium]
MQNTHDVRCGHCSKKLAVGQFLSLQIKCPRCGTLNHLRADRPTPEPREGHSIENHECPEKT